VRPPVMLLHRRLQLPLALDCVLRCFRPMSVVDVVVAVRALPDKQCSSDPLPTKLLKDNVDMIAPFLVELFNRSLAVGIVSSIFKSAFITPPLNRAISFNFEPIGTVETVGTSRLVM